MHARDAARLCRMVDRIGSSLALTNDGYNLLWGLVEVAFVEGELHATKTVREFTASATIEAQAAIARARVE